MDCRVKPGNDDGGTVIRLMADVTLVPIERLELRFARTSWPFAAARRDEIDRYFAELRRGKPELWNGRVLVLQTFAVADGVFRGTYLETDFASFLAWRDWGFPDQSVRNCFAMAALRAADGAFVLGVMASHTANAGKVYFIGGTPDPHDVAGERVDLERSVLRELAEETGLSAETVRPEPGWHAIFDEARIAMVRVLRTAELEEILYADHRWAVLAIFQAMDAGGKDSAIEHVMTGVNPQGCEVHAFKAPSAEELDHDFLWRAATRLPRRGHIGIFNRSHYEEVLVVRVRHDLLVREELPPELTTNRIWKQRFEDIVAFERHLARNGT